MSTHSLFHATATLLEMALQSGPGADRLYQQQCRQHPAWGPRERRLVGDLLFQCLRHRRLLEADLPPNLPVSGAALVEAALARWHAPSPSHEADGPTPPRNWPVTPNNLPPAVRWSLPDWLWQRFQSLWGELAPAEAEAFLEPAPLDLRVNRLKADAPMVLEKLAAQGIQAQEHPWIPGALRLGGRVGADHLGVVTHGWAEIQDAASQLIAPLCQAGPGATVVDLCAGGGGKSLHLAAMMNNHGSILASDNDARRLERMKPRLKRAGVSCVRLQPLRHERDKALARWQGQADAVLVDAPCSGLGTLRRSPELKWRLDPALLASLAIRQLSLLGAGAALVKRGGMMVYATCSPLEEENEAVVQSFLAANTAFQLLDAPAALMRRGYPLPSPGGPWLRLSPARHGTDAFCAALLRRTR
ncbi:MAG: RsmB/NOP family class I SAM-dependent RNA methyltransferase [Magnetococcus sp. WYHC-3]